MPSYPEIGSISSGTLKTEDLIGNFLSTLGYYQREKAAAIQLEYKYDDDDFDPESEEAGWMLETLFEELENIAPPFCTFGAHPGDGAEFGFWPEEPENIVDFNSEVLKVNDLPEFLMLVNDHGNVTLYRVKELEEVWSIV